MWSMEIIKTRHEPEELKYLRYLNSRMRLSSDDTNYLKYLEKGFEGEILFDRILMENLSGKWLILNDLLFVYNKTYFQIDSLAICNGKIHHFEIKYNEGDHFIDGEKWFTLNKIEIKNPYQQLIRCESLLRRLLHDLGFSDQLESNLVFVNPNFFLYVAPMNLPIIFPSQIKRFITKLNLRPTSLKESDYKLAEKLLSLHIEKSPFTRKPLYHFDQLVKGIVCVDCRSLSTEHKVEGKIVCKTCGFVEDVSVAVLRSVGEFTFLFPELKITSNVIFEWCRVIKSRKTIWNILRKNFVLIGHSKSSYYVKNEK
jgi:hypothetical protein